MCACVCVCVCVKVMSTRDDHVITVHYPDNTTVVEHADGTRISTVMQSISTIANTADAYETGRCNYTVITITTATATPV